MSDCDLDVTTTTLTLSVPGFSKVVEAFPAAVAFQDAAAKFNKRRKVLAVTVPLLP